MKRLIGRIILVIFLGILAICLTYLSQAFSANDQPFNVQISQKVTFTQACDPNAKLPPSIPRNLGWPIHYIPNAKRVGCNYVQNINVGWFLADAVIWFLVLLLAWKAVFGLVKKLLTRPNLGQPA